MGGQAPSNRTAGRVTAQQFMQYLPELTQVASGAQGGADVSAAQSVAATTPMYSQTGLDNLQRYALPYANVGNEVTRANALAGSNTQADILAGPGARIASAASDISKANNPEYYATRTATSGRLNDLMSSINLNGLSGGETAAIERSLNQSNTATGNMGVDNATNAVGNALMFGQGLQQKRDALGAAIGQANNFLTSTGTNASFNPVATALTTPSTQGNFGTSQFAGVAPSGSQAYNLGSNLLGQIGSQQNTNQQLQAQSSYNNSAAGIMGSLPSYS